MTREPWSHDEEPDVDVELSVRPAEGPNPPNAFKQALTIARDALPKLVESAKRWAFGKALQETGKATEVYEKISREKEKLELERQRLVAEREDRAHRAVLEDARQRTANDLASAEALKLKAEAIRAISEAAKNLRDAGCTAADIIAFVREFQLTLGVSTAIIDEAATAVAIETGMNTGVSMASESDEP